MRMRIDLRPLVVFAAVSVVLSASGMAVAQEDLQRCEGAVTDDAGNPLPGVKIRFKDVDKNLEVQPVVTNKKGRYAHNTLRASSNPGWEISAHLEGHMIVKITALTMSQTGGKAEDETYLVGGDQKVHKVSLPAQGRTISGSKGKCVVDFVMVPEDRHAEVRNRLDAERQAKAGGAPAAAGSPPGSEVAGGSPAPATGAPSPKDPFQKGRELIASGDYAGAIAPLQEAVAAKPDHAEAHARLGEAYLKVENMAEAEPALKKGLELDPTVTGLNFSMGMLYVKKGRLMQAIPHFEKELEMFPESASILQNLAKLYTDTQQFDKAIEKYEKLITLAPDNIEYYGSLADAYKQMGNAAKEMEVYRRMGEQDSSGMAFFNLGNIMFNKNEMTQAAEAYKKAIQQAPDNAAAHYQLGLTYVNLAKFKEAVAELETFAKLKPKDPKAEEAKSLAADLKKMGG